MRLTVAAVGRLKRGPESELSERYRDRAAKAGRGIGIQAIDLVELTESRAREGARRQTEESIALAQLIPEGATAILLDRTGDNIGTEALTTSLQNWRDEGRTAVVFLIGGPDGVAPALREKANVCLAFGKATWPHQLIRIMLLEQIYRAITIMSGHPYHRA